jgi:hypothetical protein
MLGLADFGLSIKGQGRIKRVEAVEPFAAAASLVGPGQEQAEQGLSLSGGRRVQAAAARQAAPAPPGRAERFPGGASKSKGKPCGWGPCQWDEVAVPAWGL